MAQLGSSLWLCPMVSMTFFARVHLELSASHWPQPPSMHFPEKRNRCSGGTSPDTSFTKVSVTVIGVSR
ncbi:MAG: hypothetical protein PSV16_04235 [Flavobacterium sp.]|nr:hypothetical protein [Flavobacterium sp.]